VYKAAGIAALLHQLVHQGQNRVPDVVRLTTQKLKVQGGDVAAGGDLLGCIRGDDPTSRFGPRQCNLDLDVATDQGMIREYFSHLRRAKRIAE
jgi:hypothetical protein